MKTYHFCLLVFAITILSAAFAQQNPDESSGVNLAVVAKPSGSYVSGDTTLAALNDENEPRSSRDNRGGSYGNWNRTGTQWVQYVDADQVVFPIVLRCRRPGDAFQPLGMQGKKRVKKFFIDRKILRNKRESIPIFEDLNGIFWIVGYSIDERVKITPHTTRVLRCCVHHTG